MPRVTVLMPVRRPRLDWLREAVSSVLQQSFTDFEFLVVVDDAPSLSDFLKSFADPRIRELHLPDMPGLPVALNRGVAAADGDLVARLDADDICEPVRLARQVEMFEAQPDLDIVGSQLLVIDADGKPIGERRYPLAHPDIARTMLRHNPLGHPSVMFRRRRILAAGGYPIAPMEDYDLWCGLLLGGARFANHPDLLVRYRYTAGLTRGNVRHTLRATIDIKRRHFASRLTLRARLRLTLERMLMLLPAAGVNVLFRMTAFRRLSQRRESQARERAL